MSLKDLDGRLPTVVKTCREDPYQRIVIPCLKEAKEFYLGTGFFGAEWVDLAKDGLLQFVKNGGKMKLLTSVKVGEEEFEAFQKGEKAKTDAVLERALFKEVYENSKKENKEWMLNYLAWMVSNDILEVRLLVHKSSDVHMYHDKISLWIDDEGNKVASLGSMNSTLNGVKNEELIYSCFSWTSEGNESISDIEDGWNYDWEGKPEEYFLLELPDIVKMDYKQIASHSNPYDVEPRQSSFTAYTKNGFGRDKQKELKELCDKLLDKGVSVAVSNSNTEFIRNLYNPEDEPRKYVYKILNDDTLRLSRNIAGKSSCRRQVNEALIIGKPKVKRKKK